MYAVVVRVKINDSSESAVERVRTEVAPNVAKSPGFQAGYWTRAGDDGSSMVIYDTEENARAAAERVPTVIPEGVTLQDVQVREVVASA